MYFSLEKLINYKGNRYELSKACMEYAKKVRYLESDEYHRVAEKDALVSLKAILDGKIQYTREEVLLPDLEPDMPERESKMETEYDEMDDAE